MQQGWQDAWRAAAQAGPGGPLPRDLGSEKQSQDREEVLCSAAVEPRWQVAQRREEAVCGGSCSLGGSGEGRVSCHRPPHVPCTDSRGPVLSICDGDAGAGKGRLMQGPSPWDSEALGSRGPSCLTGSGFQPPIRQREGQSPRVSRSFGHLAFYGGV